MLPFRQSKLPYRGVVNIPEHWSTSAEYTIIIKIILISFLTGCLFQMPYSYYEVTRIVAMVGFGYMAYLEYEARRIPLVALYAVGVILFNPFVKFEFRRQEWQIIDKWCIGILIGLLIIDALKTKQNRRIKYSNRS